MKRCTAAATISVLSILSACQTKPIEAMGYTERKELLNTLTKRCVDQGVKANTREMDMCLTAEASAEQYRRAQNRALLEDTGDGLANAGAQMQAAAAANRPVNCTSRTGYGGVVRTTCF